MQKRKNLENRDIGHEPNGGWNKGQPYPIYIQHRFHIRDV